MSKADSTSPVGNFPLIPLILLISNNVLYVLTMSSTKYMLTVVMNR